MMIFLPFCFSLSDSPLQRWNLSSPIVEKNSWPAPKANLVFAKSTNWETISKYLLTCDIVHVVLFSCNINAIILLFKKLSQTPELKTAHSFYSVSMSQEDSLAGSSAQALSRSAHKVSGKLCSHLKAHLGKDISTATLRLLAEFIRSHSILLFQS